MARMTKHYFVKLFKLYKNLMMSVYHCDIYTDEMRTVYCSVQLVTCYCKRNLLESRYVLITLQPTLHQPTNQH